MYITIHFSVHLKLTQHGDQLYFNNFLKKITQMALIFKIV